MDVSQTILLVGELHKKGHEVIFGQHSCLRAGEEDVPLIKVGNLTYVEVMALLENAVDPAPGRPSTAYLNGPVTLGRNWLSGSSDMATMPYV
eukprot:979429-Heterocapsa_arctica.AAC.1